MKSTRRCHLLITAICWAFCISAPGSTRDDILKLADSGQHALAGRDPYHAQSVYLSALKLAESSEDYTAAAAIHCLIGEIQEGAAKYQQALGRYETALRILDNRSTGGQARSLDEDSPVPNLGGKGYMRSSGRPVSVDLYRGEVDLRQLFANPEKAMTLRAILLMNAGNMYLNQSQYGPAEALYRQADKLIRKIDPDLHRKILVNLAWSAIKRNDADADTRLTKAMATLPTSPPPVEFRRAILALGVRQREKQQYPQAIRRITEALKLYKAASDQKGYGRALAQLGSAYLQAGNLDKAKESYADALRANQEVGDLETTWHAEAGLGKCYDLAGNAPEAFDHYTAYLDAVGWIASDFTTDQGQISFLEQHDDFFQDYARLAMRAASNSGYAGAARNAIERVRAKGLEPLLTSRSEYGPVTPGHLSARYVVRGEEKPPFPSQTAAGVSYANQAAPGVELHRFDPGLAAASAGWKTATPPPITFLEYYVTDDSTAIFVKDPQGNASYAKANIGTAALQELVEEYRHALDVQGLRGGLIVSGPDRGKPSERAETGKRTVPELAEMLYRLLVAPVAQQLPSGSQTPIAIVPHRALWTLPFAALRPAGGDYLGDQHVLTYAASEDTWRLAAGHARSADQKNVHAWIAGNPKMPTGGKACDAEFSFQSLAGAGEEAQAIAALFPPENVALFTGDQADRFRLDAWHSDFTVLHLATHGFACLNNPLDSFVVLSQLEPDGVTIDPAARRISRVGDLRLPVIIDADDNWEWKGLAKSDRLLNYPGILDGKTIINHFRLRADLVTLSACQTGLGKVLSQGSIGLTRAFMAAGARSVLASLWRVDDDSTKDLMINFYKEYLQHGNKGMALQNAMKQTRLRYPEPRDWAAFSLFGMAE
jgi:CHAT domain-containing protein/tetratricopeptide (TPR) repeat protein